MNEAFQNSSAQTWISHYPDSGHDDPSQTVDKASWLYSSSQLQALCHTCRGQWHCQSTQLCDNNLAQGSLRCHSGAVTFSWAKAKQEHISNNMQEVVQSTCLAQLSQGHQGNGPCFSWPQHHKWLALSGSLVPQRTSPATWPCTNISLLSH